MVCTNNFATVEIASCRARCNGRTRRLALSQMTAALLVAAMATAVVVPDGKASADPVWSAGISSPAALTDRAFARAAAGDRTGAQLALDALPRELAAAVVAVISNVDAALRFPLADQVPAGINPASAVVILGFGLMSDGSLREGLIDRMRQGLSVATTYPDMPVVVTGANPRGGHTEAEAMRDWLVNAGLPPERITTETASVSTVGNAVNTAALLRARDISGAVLITSPDHLRRAVADFLVAGVALHAVLASPGPAPGREQIAAIYADARAVADI